MELAQVEGPIGVGTVIRRPVPGPRYPCRGNHGEGGGVRARAGVRNGDPRWPHRDAWESNLRGDGARSDEVYHVRRRAWLRWGHGPESDDQGDGAKPPKHEGPHRDRGLSPSARPTYSCLVAALTLVQRSARRGPSHQPPGAYLGAAITTGWSEWVSGKGLDGPLTVGPGLVPGRRAGSSWASVPVRGQRGGGQAPALRRHTYPDTCQTPTDTSASPVQRCAPPRQPISPL